MDSHGWHSRASSKERAAGEASQLVLRRKAFDNGRVQPLVAPKVIHHFTRRQSITRKGSTLANLHCGRSVPRPFQPLATRWIRCRPWPACNRTSTWRCRCPSMSYEWRLLEPPPRGSYANTPLGSYPSSAWLRWRRYRCAVRSVWFVSKLA